MSTLQSQLMDLAQSMDLADPNRERLRALAQRVGDLEGDDFERGFAALTARCDAEAMFVLASPSRLSRRQQLSFGGHPDLRDFVSRMMEAGARAEQAAARAQRTTGMVRVVSGLPRGRAPLQG